MDVQAARDREDTYVVTPFFDETRTKKDILIEIILKELGGTGDIIFNEID